VFQGFAGKLPGGNARKAAMGFRVVPVKRQWGLPLLRGLPQKQLWELVCVGAGLPAMQTPRYFSDTEVMLSQASQLPHKPGSHVFDAYLAW
jgi:hypothetical protein